MRDPYEQMSFSEATAKTTAQSDTNQSDIERVAAALAAGGLKVIDVKPFALLAESATGGHLMIGVQKCK